MTRINLQRRVTDDATARSKNAAAGPLRHTIAPMNFAPIIEESSIDPSITCSTCKACCCKLEVMLMGDDDVPPALSMRDRWGGEVMRRLEDGWCAALDRRTMLCTIYARRPQVCADYAAGDIECLIERRAMAD